MSSIHNKLVDALQASKVDLPNRTVDMKITKRTLRATVVDMILIQSFDEKG